MGLPACVCLPLCTQAAVTLSGNQSVSQEGKNKTPLPLFSSSPLLLLLLPLMPVACTAGCLLLTPAKIAF